MKILITMLSILYSSYLYADLNLDESYSYPMLREKLELNRNLNIDQLRYRADLNLDESYSYPTLREKLELNRNLNINQRTYVDHDIENPPKPYKPKDKCMTAICMDPKVVMSKKPIKDYSDVVTKPSYVGTTVEETVEAAVRAEKARLEKEKEKEKEKK